MKIIKYEILTGSTASKLNDKVNELIGKGWVPYGSVTSTLAPGNSGGYIEYAQPMVKYGE